MTTVSKTAEEILAELEDTKFEGYVTIGKEYWVCGFKVANGGRGQKLMVHCPPTKIIVNNLDTGSTKGRKVHQLYRREYTSSTEFNGSISFLTPFKSEEDCINYYNALVQVAVEYKKNCIEKLNKDVARYEAYSYIDGKPQVQPKKSKKSNLVI